MLEQTPISPIWRITKGVRQGRYVTNVTIFQFRASSLTYEAWKDT